MDQMREINIKLDKLIDDIERLDRKVSSVGKTITMLIDNINGYQGSVNENNVLMRGCIKEVMGVKEKDLPSPIGKREQILEMYNSGISISAIAKLVKCSRATVYKYLGE